MQSSLVRGRRERVVAVGGMEGRTHTCKKKRKRKKEKRTCIRTHGDDGRKKEKDGKRKNYTYASSEATSLERREFNERIVGASSPTGVDDGCNGRGALTVVGEGNALFSPPTDPQGFLRSILYVRGRTMYKPRQSSASHQSICQDVARSVNHIVVHQISPTKDRENRERERYRIYMFIGLSV